MYISLISDAVSSGHATGDELNGIENVTGSAYADTLVGNDGVNVLNGGSGDDLLKGWAAMTPSMVAPMKTRSTAWVVSMS